MKESSECMVWKGDNKETEGPQSVGGRNGDQYGTTVREGGREKKKAGREADRAREAWRSDRGREGVKDGHSLTVQDRGGRRGGEGDEGGRMRGIHSAERKGRATKATMRRRERKNLYINYCLRSKGQWSIVRA